MGACSSSPKIEGGRLHGERTYLNGSTIHPECEVSCHGTESICIISSSVIRRGQPNSGESCITLQSGLTRSLDAKFPQRSVIACNTQISCCRGRMLRIRSRTGVCEPWICHSAQSASEQSQLCALSGLTYLRIHYARI